MSSKLKPEYQNLLDSFVENLRTLTEAELSTIAVNIGLKIKEIKEAKEADEKLKAAKELVRDLGAAYAEATKYETRRLEVVLESIRNLRSARADLVSNDSTT
jgi:hypothetical protein